MKTLSDFKRLMVLGAKVRVTWHYEIRILGNTGNTVLPVPPTEERHVSVVQSNGIAFRRPDGRDSWLYWPKAADFKVEEGKACFYSEGKKLLTYEVL